MILMMKIPGFSKYEISRDGLLLRVRDQTQVGGSINKDGYCHFRIVNDAGETITVGRHRLIALAWLECIDPTDLYVNHKNGVKGDDRVDNLEWVTPRENVEHAGALGLTEKCKPVQGLNPDNSVTTYPSAAALARDLGVTKDAALYRANSLGSVKFPEGRCYRWSSDLEWPTPRPAGKAKAVWTKSMVDDRVTEYSSLSHLASKLGVSKSTLTMWFAKNSQPALPDFTIAKCGDVEWRTFGDKFVEVTSTIGTRAVAVLDAAGSGKVYLSLRECASHHGLSITALHYRLQSNGRTVFPDGLRYQYYDTVIVHRDGNITNEIPLIAGNS